MVFSGCSGIENSVEEANQTVAQGKEDLAFLSWMSGSMQVIKDDYANISASLSATDGEKLAESAARLKQDSTEATIELGNYSLSPSVQNVSDKYHSFLNRSYDFGDSMEKNAGNIEYLNMSSTMEDIDEGLAMWEELFSELR
jgi:antirestriction protein